MSRRLLALACAALLVTGAVFAPPGSGHPAAPPAPAAAAMPALHLAPDDPQQLMPHRRPAPPRPPAPLSRAADVKPRPPAPAWVHPLASGRSATSCYRTARRPGHGGIDIPQPTGTPIRATAAGVIHVKAYESGGAGYYVAISHGGGVFTRMHHLRAASPLAKGARVEAGQVVGYVGATGNATGPHLHFEVHVGGYGNAHRVNPAPFLRSRGVSAGC